MRRDYKEMGESYKIEIDKRLIWCLEVLHQQLKKPLEQNQSLWKLYWLHREKSILNTFIALCCLRKQNLLHLDYELFVYELSCLSGQLEGTSIIISSVYKTKLSKISYFSHVSTAAVFKPYIVWAGLPCWNGRILEWLSRSGSLSGPPHLQWVRCGLHSLISVCVIAPVAPGIFQAPGCCAVLGEWLRSIHG